MSMLPFRFFFRFFGQTQAFFSDRNPVPICIFFRWVNQNGLELIHVIYFVNVIVCFRERSHHFDCVFLLSRTRNYYTLFNMAHEPDMLKIFCLVNNTLAVLFVPQAHLFHTVRFNRCLRCFVCIVVYRDQFGCALSMLARCHLIFI